MRGYSILGGFLFPYKTQPSAKRATDDLIYSGRSYIKIKKDPTKIDLWGTPDRTGTGSENPTPFFESAQGATSCSTCE